MQARPAHCYILLAAMGYDPSIEERIRQRFDSRRISYETKRMMGGICFMVDGKMCVGVEKNRLMARIGPEAYDDALKRRGCRPMDFTGRPMSGFVFVEGDGLKTDQDLAFWLKLALDFNPKAQKSAKKSK